MRQLSRKGGAFLFCLSLCFPDETCRKRIHAFRRREIVSGRNGQVRSLQERRSIRTDLGSDIRHDGIDCGVVQHIAVHGAVLLPGEKFGVRPRGIQRLQALNPGQRRRLLFGAQKGGFLLLVAAYLLYGSPNSSG